MGYIIGVIYIYRDNQAGNGNYYILIGYIFILGLWIWGIWGSYYNIPKAIFYLLKEDYKPQAPNLEPQTLNPFKLQMPVISPPNSLVPKRECGKGAIGMVDTKCHAGSSVFVLLSRKPALLELMDVVQFEGGGSEADSEADLALELTCYNVPCPYSPQTITFLVPLSRSKRASITIFLHLVESCIGVSNGMGLG